MMYHRTHPHALPQRRNRLERNAADYGAREIHGDSRNGNDESAQLRVSQIVEVDRYRLGIAEQDR